MPWNGSGTFVPALTIIPNTPATAEDQNTQDVDIAAGITNSLARDGQAPATANIPFGGNKITGLGNGSATTDGAAFGQLATLLPPGIVLPTAGSSVPTGYLLCNGQAVSRTTFAALFGVIATTYGAGDGSTTFNIPNLVGRVIAGVDQTGTVLSSFSINNPGTPGGVGGFQGHALSTPELAAHGHSVTVNDPSHVHGFSDPGHAHNFSEDVIFNTTVGAGGSAAFAVTGLDTGTTTTNGTNIGIFAAATGITASANSTGSSNQHLNVQPTMVMFYIIKT